MASESCNVHFAGGEKVRVDGTVDEVASKLSPSAAGAHGFCQLEARGEPILIRPEAVTHIATLKTGVASF